MTVPYPADPALTPATTSARASDPDALAEAIEATRTDVRDTVTELSARLAPSHIAHDVATTATTKAAVLTKNPKAWLAFAALTAGAWWWVHARSHTGGA